MTPEELAENALAALGAFATVEPSDVGEYARLLLTYAEVLRAARTIEDAMHHNLARLMGDEKKVTVEGLGVLERRRSASRKWDHESLLGVVRQRAITDRKVQLDTGEIESPDEAFMRVLRDAAAFSYWRIGKLKSMDIDPDEYCKTSWGSTRVVIH